MIFDIGQMHTGSPFLAADLIELLLLTGYWEGSEIHKSHVADLIERTPVSDEEVDDEESVREARRSLSSAERSNSLEQKLDDIWSQFEYRSACFRNAYPFNVNNEMIEVEYVSSEAQRVYLMLLACSRLRSFPSQGGVRQEWAKCFVRLSSIAMTQLLPPFAVCRIFDANSDDRKSYFGTNLQDAIYVLAKDIRAEVLNIEELHTSGDLGIDLVGYVPINDSVGAVPVILGQCGAQETEWPSKNYEAHPISHRGHLHTFCDWVSAAFTPVCYRSSSGRWVKSKSASGIVVIDRVRMLDLLGRSEELLPLIASSTWMTKFFGYVRISQSPDCLQVLI